MLGKVAYYASITALFFGQIMLKLCSFFQIMLLFLDFALQKPLQVLQRPFILVIWFGNWLIRSCNGTFVVSHVPLLLYFPFLDCRERLAIVADSGPSFLRENSKFSRELASIADANL